MAGKKKDIDADTPKWEDVPEIPKEEQPWPLPDGWKWVKVGDILNLQAGKNITSKFINSIKTADYQYPCYGGNGVRGYVKEFNHNGEFFIIGRQGALCGNIHHVCGKFYATEHAVVVTSKTYYIDINYAGNYLEFINLNQYATATAQPGLAVSNILKLPFLLPPLSIQHRIVTTIESLFSKLDEAAEKVQAVLDGHEARKQAILHKAFSGELTKKWRKENGVSLDSWEEKKLGYYVDVQYGYTEKSSTEGIGPKFLRITDIQNGFVDWKSVPYCKINKENYLKYKLNVNDIVIARTGATTGKSYLIYENVDSIFASYLIRLKIKKFDELNPLFLSLFLNSPIYWKQIVELSSGIAQPGVNGKKLKTLITPIPTINEQYEIVKVVESLFMYEEQIMNTSSSTIDKINNLKKIFLFICFRGNIIF